MLHKLNKRERIGAGLAVSAVSIFVLIQFVIAPFWDQLEQRKRAVLQKTNTLGEMYELKAEYQGLKALAEQNTLRAAKREKDFTLFSFLDRLAGETGLKERIIYMKPSTTRQPNSPFKKSVVEMKLQGLVLDQLAQFLHRAETSGQMITVRRLSISKEGAEGTLLTAIIQVETVEA